MDRTVTIAGEQYEVKFPVGLRFRQELEKRTGKSIADSFTSGMINDHAAIICAGLRHVSKKISPDDIIDMLQAHEDAGGDSDDVVKQVFAIAFNDKLLGVGSNYDALRRAFGIDGDQGKGQTTPEGSEK